ncbi:hypothetical protein Phi19:3_gp110 [Cellulophaga phage phi19:3]|uniref:Uncharacterized protein n=1 Tax=Cellulophaga phage phi19:3 TaxID=1327971 RepID=R9ZWD8_9CAUD|nr:hypothetical protein Phi19:3_gp110 [Cellulophaga phage phi19:3]AGO47514.1 hypothetical protein Phi19:3_gp110 [Cellulophaga phage phi19:3]
MCVCFFPKAQSPLVGALFFIPSNHLPLLYLYNPETLRA